MRHLIIYTFAIFVLVFGCSDRAQEQAFKQERDTLTSLNEIFETQDTDMLVQALRVIPGQSWSLWSPQTDGDTMISFLSQSTTNERKISWDSLRYQFINDSTVRAFALDNDTVYQTLTYSNDTLRISNGNYVVIPSSVTDSTYILTQISDSIDVRHCALTPRDFGAVGDNSTDDASAFQAMFDYAEDNSKYFIDLEAMSYYVASAIILPDSFPGTNNRLIIEGNGASIRTDQDINIFQRRPATSSYDNTLIDDSYITIRKTRFDGDNAGGVGLWLAATYNAVIEDCQFTQLDTGLFMPFALNAHIHRNRFLNNNVRDFVGSSGSVYGATAASSAFNANTIERNRHFGKAGMETMIHIESADGNLIKNNITEGATPRIEIYVSTELTVTKSNSIENHWSETTADSNIVVKWDQGSGNLLSIKNLQSNSYDTLIMIDGSSSDGRIIIDQLSASGTHIYSNRSSGTPTSLGATWYFWNQSNRPSSQIPDDLITDNSLWDGATIPNGVIVENPRSENTGWHNITSSNQMNFYSYNGGIEIKNDFVGSVRDILIDSDDDIFLQADDDVILQQEDLDPAFTFDLNTQEAYFGTNANDEGAYRLQTYGAIRIGGGNIGDLLVEGNTVLEQELTVADSVIINGLSIYSGTAAPSSSIGSQGSLYMRDDNDSTLYTKTAAGWVLIN